MLKSTSSCLGLIPGDPALADAVHTLVAAFLISLPKAAVYGPMYVVWFPHQRPFSKVLYACNFSELRILFQIISRQANFRTLKNQLCCSFPCVLALLLVPSSAEGQLISIPLLSYQIDLCIKIPFLSVSIHHSQIGTLLCLFLASDFIDSLAN